jgi:hypothetical protein
MKQLLFIVALFTTSVLLAQKISAPVTVKAGSATYVTINGQDYPRNGYFGFVYTYNTTDSQVGIYYTNGGYQFLKQIVDTNFYFGDTTNKQVRNMSSLRTWLRTNAY